MELQTRATTAEAASARPAAGLLAALVALALSLGALCAAPAAAWAASDDIASGTSGSCDWVIDADGVLTISPSKGASGTLESYSEWDPIDDDCLDELAPWLSYRDSITAAVIEDGVCAGEEAAALFYDCENMASVEGLDNLDLSNTTSLYALFRGCSSLVNLDAGGLDVSNATNMNSTFYHCAATMPPTRADFPTWRRASTTRPRSTGPSRTAS